MTDCCAPGPEPVQHRCPVNGKSYKPVSKVTILHHIRAPWDWARKDQKYYFCDDPQCDVVYFGDDDSVIRKTELRTAVGIKDTSDDALLCYCFGVTRKEAASNPTLRAFVLLETRRQACACGARNPSGRCCLKDFPPC